MALLKFNKNLQEKYEEAFQNKFEVLREAKEMDQYWTKFKEVPKVKRKTKQRWIAKDTFGLMKNRRQVKNSKEKYETLHKGNQNKNMMKSKRSGSMTRAETSNYTAEVQSRQCTKTLKKSLESLSTGCL